MRPQKENPLPVAKFCPIPGPFAVTLGHGGEVGVDDGGDFKGREFLFAHPFAFRLGNMASNICCSDALCFSRKDESFAISPIA